MSTLSEKLNNKSQTDFDTYDKYLKCNELSFGGEFEIIKVESQGVYNHVHLIGGKPHSNCIEMHAKWPQHMQNMYLQASLFVTSLFS